MHTWKNQFIVLPNGEDIADVTVGELGKTTDINLCARKPESLWQRAKFSGRQSL